MPFLLVPTHCIFTLCSRFFRVWLSLFTTSPAPRQPRCAPQLVGAALVLFAIAWLPGARGADLILSWTDNSNNEEGFQIDRSVAGGPFVTIARTGPNVVTYTDKTLLPATFYSYRLRAYKGALASAFTTVVSATTAAALPSSNGPVSSNTPPTVTAISSRSLTVGAVTAAIPFTIGDSTTATTALVVSATSSNPAVLPQASLVLGGTGANRTLTLRPPSAVGSTVI
ncbi:MAG TPA: fibronectin type III domain-containing protein, partial [Opitutaceae bacterium]|nr:fibronectin type III domain-containing protein [Opitutaceae bacterium]